MRLRTDELKREETEAGALLGRQFLDDLSMSRRNLDMGELSYEDREKFLRQAERLKIRLEDCGAIGGEVLDEYAQAKQRDEGYEKELNDLAAAEKSLREIMAELANKIESDFFGGVEKINEEFRKFFVSVFGGRQGGIEFGKNNRREKTRKKSFPTRQDSPLRFATRQDWKQTQQMKTIKKKRALRFPSATPKKNFFAGNAFRRRKVAGRYFLALRDVSSQSAAVFDFRRNGRRFGRSQFSKIRFDAQRFGRKNPACRHHPQQRDDATGRYYLRHHYELGRNLPPLSIKFDDTTGVLPFSNRFAQEN